MNHGTVAEVRQWDGLVLDLLLYVGPIISDQTGSVMNEETNLQQRPGRSAGLALLCYSNRNISMQILKAHYFSVCIHM